MSALGQTVRRLGYARARALLLVVGLAVLLLLALITYTRRVETVEVVGTLLFIPVFVSFVLWRVWGGVLAGVATSVVYVILRLPAIDAIGLDRFLGLIVSRSAALILFGALGGWATQQLERSIRKLELYDQVDDATGLLNARFLLEETDLEMSRSNRYRTVFSVATVEFRDSVFNGISRRKAGRALRDLARDVRESIRLVDRAVHSADGDRHLIAVILPETGGEGAAVFTERLAERVARHLAGARTGKGAADMDAGSFTFPDDEDRLRSFREEIRRIDAQEHPGEPSPPPASPAEE